MNQRKALTVGIGTVVILGLLAGCAGGGPSRATSAASTTTTSSSTTTPAAVSPVTASGDPWLAYLTAVDPGSSIEFTTDEVGWRLDGQGATPGVDDNLASGPGAQVAQPGSSVAATADGGRTWRTILRVPSGVWGVDLVSPRVGYAVGVTGLHLTDDGGATWTSLQEPTPHPLVWAQFTSVRQGYGLTTKGVLVTTTDGGRSWHPGALRRTATAACFASPRLGYATDPAGDVLVTRDGARSWVVAKRGPGHIEQFYGPWADLSCSGPDVMVGLEYFCGAACGASHPYLVERSTTSGRTWVGPKPTTAGVPGAANAVFGAVATDQQVSVLAALPDENSETPSQQHDVTLLSAPTPRARYTRASEPALPGTQTAALAAYRATVLGLDLRGSHGWLYLDVVVNRTANAVSMRPVVWATIDGGRSWRLRSEGPG